MNMANVNILDDFVINVSYDAFDQEYEELMALIAELRENDSDLKN